MQCLDKVYQRMLENCIELFNFETDTYDAATIKYNDTYGIFADFRKFPDLKSEFMALSHEYGHCSSGTTHKVYSPFELISQHENRANRAAVYEFLPCEILIEAVEHGNTELWQISEYLDIPEEFVKMAIDIYSAEERL